MMGKVMGLDDPLWVGYWSGGASMALALFIPYAITGSAASLPIALLSWVAMTPFGIFIAKRTR